MADAIGVGCGVGKEGIAIHLREWCQECISAHAAEAAGGCLVIGNTEIAELADEVVRAQGGGAVAALTWPDACDSIGREHGACGIEGSVKPATELKLPSLAIARLPLRLWTVVKALRSRTVASAWTWLIRAFRSALFGSRLREKRTPLVELKATWLLAKSPDVNKRKRLSARPVSWSRLASRTSKKRMLWPLSSWMSRSKELPAGRVTSVLSRV